MAVRCRGHRARCMMAVRCKRTSSAVCGGHPTGSVGSSAVGNHGRCSLGPSHAANVRAAGHRTQRTLEQWPSGAMCHERWQTPEQQAICARKHRAAATVRRAEGNGGSRTRPWRTSEQRLASEAALLMGVAHECSERRSRRAAASVRRFKVNNGRSTSTASK